jgi:RecB family exonuclease
MASDPVELHPVSIVSGARAAQDHLLAGIAPWVEETRRDPSRAGLPVRIAVPSRSLREHLCAALIDRFGAVAGISVRTLYSFALEVAEREGERPPARDDFFPVWLRRIAREERVLREGFDSFADGYGLVEAGVSDLLDAGFEAHHAEAVDEQLVDAGGGAVLARARAVARVAAGADRELSGAPFGHRARLFRRAREVIERDPAGALPGRALFVHGFADATGVQADLIESLVRLCGARVILDHPPDPVTGGESETAFSQRFSDRLVGAAAGADTIDAAVSSPRFAIVHAPGPHAEARSLAERVRAALDAGVRPERIGVVARSLSGYAIPLRQHFGRLGIPFSGVGARGPLSVDGRALVALLNLVARRERTPAERWLDVRAFDGRSSDQATAVERADLLLLLHSQGAARLEDVAGIDLEDDDRKRFPLPVQAGLDEAGRSTPRTVSRAVLKRAVADARAVLRRLARWPEHARLADHREELRALVEGDLGWRDGTPGHGALAETVFERSAELPEDFDLSRDDFRLLLERWLAREGVAPLGGEGGGVQVLDAMEARARTFERLFVLGLTRGVFPRSVTEDPLLPDSLRRSMRQVLPDLPVKSEGRDEERYLFAQLLSSSPDVTLSCPLTDDEGKAQSLSPLLERFASRDDAPEPEIAPSLYGMGALRPERQALPRPAHEHAVLSGLHGSRTRFARILPVALAEVGCPPHAQSGRDNQALARARAAVLLELDPPTRLQKELGPYFGFAGPEVATGRDLPFVTGLEGLARCPWQTFLGRVLRLERLPDALHSLPSVDSRVLGMLVHRVLEKVVEAAGDTPRALDDAVGGEPVDVAWPVADAFESILERAANEVASDEGIALPGFASVLAMRARDRLDLARQRDWSNGSLPVLGVEVEGSLELAHHDPARHIRFRADRVDRVDGELRFTDYKTGRPSETQKTPSIRVANYRKRVQSGEMLQGVAYALAGAAFAPSRGRYLYLNPRDEPELGDVEVRSDQDEFVQAFEDATGRVLEVWDRGAFFPRLVGAGGNEPQHCQWCEVKVACLRGDSGARRRLLKWFKESPRASAADPALAAIRGAWELGPKR